MHFDRDYAVTLAGLAASTLHVEREPTRTETARLRLRHHREQVANKGEEACVGRRIRTGRSANRRLIDLDDFVDELDAVDPVVRAGFVRRFVESSRERLVQDVVDQR